MRRVVVTGMGLVTPLGVGVAHNWEKLIGGQSGISGIQSFDVSDLPAKVAGQVPVGDRAGGGFNPDEYVPPKDQRKMDRFIQLALGAAEEAIQDSGWVADSEEKQERTGVSIGSGIGGLPAIDDGAVTLHTKGPRRISPFFIPSSLINLASGHVSIKYGLRGPNHAVVTACSTGAHSIGDAARMIMWDDADVMVAGGAEAAVSRLGLGGFAAARALSTAFNDTPTRASRPYDKARDGFVMGEGAGVVVIEALEHALLRGAVPLAELVGYGTTADAYHMTSGPADGEGAA
ncbi:MAG TPA: beta-ketoacyl-ACP synthase II, partial [Alphaproteobacteria bacterium]|nr:beta-ketoacyl-ACP synthase II [Alphaproteobacteria bacterium]